MPRIFLSHSSGDNREATALKKWLVDQDPELSRQIFLDTDRDTGMVVGQWEETIRRNLAGCRALLVLLSERWEASKECYWEYRDAESKGKPIYVARIDDRAGLGLISKYQRRELYVTEGDASTSIELPDRRPPVVFASDGLERLLRDIGTRRLGAEAFTWPPVGEPGRAPYRGWRPFESCDAAVYFGREVELNSALRKFDEMAHGGGGRLFVILGPSGTGKSSFLRAGLLPRLNDDRFVTMNVVRPGRDEALTGDLGCAVAVHRLRDDLGLTEPTLGELRADWVADSAKFRRLLVECQERLSDRDIQPTLVLPIDQAEELFSAESGREAIALLQLLRDLLTPDPAAARPLRLIVVSTIRTDRYEVMQTADELAGVDSVLFNDLRPMRADRFREVIEGPARRSTEGGRALVVQPQLVERLLTDCTAGAAAGGDTLPLLSGTLHRLYADYGANGELTLAQYDQLGGIGRVVRTEIDKILSLDPPVRADQLKTLRRAFIPWLATVSDTDEPMRRIALWRDLPPDSLQLVDKMVDARILIKDRRALGDGQGGEQDVVEIALESFLRQWDELAGWLREQREDLKFADEILRDATRWQTSHQDSAYLYPGPLVEKAEALSADATFSRKLEPTREFLVASRQRVTEDQRDKEAMLRRNTVRLAIVLAVTVLVAVGAVGAFFWARHAQQVAQRSAQDATAQKLVAEAQARLQNSGDGNDVLAMSELLVANTLASTPVELPLLDALVNRIGMRKVLYTLEPVVGVSFADDGHRLAMAQPAGIQVWNTAATGWEDRLNEPQWRLASGASKLTSVAISRDGRRVVAGNDAGAVLSWDLAQPDPNPDIVGRPHEGRVTSVAVSRDGRIASAGVDGVVSLTGSSIVPVQTGAEVFTVAFAPAGDRIAIGGSDGSIRLFDVTGPAPVAGPVIPTAHADGVMSVVFSPDGRLLASGGADSTLRLWDAATLAPRRDMAGHTATITSVAFNHDGTRIASVGNDKTVQMWDVATGHRIGDPMRGHAGLALAVAFVSDGNEIVSGGNEHTLRLWDADLGQPLSTPISSRTGPVTDVAISPDGREVASAGTDRTVRLWDLDTGTQVDQLAVHKGVVSGVAFSPVERLIASAGTDGTVALWRPGTRMATTQYDVSQPLTGVAFSPDGKRVAVGGVDGKIRLWDITTNREAVLDSGDGSILYNIAFPPTGDRLASVNAGGTLRMWDLADGHQMWSTDPIDAVPDGVKTTEQLAPGYPGALISVAFTPDGQQVVTGGVDWTTAGGAVGFLQVFGSADGKPVGGPVKVGNAVMDIAFSPHDATSAVVASFDPYEVQVRDLNANGAVRFVFPDHQAQVVSVAVSADGKRVVSGSADGTVRVWPNLPAGSAAEALCAKLSPTSQEVWQDRVSSDIPQPTCSGAGATAAK